MPTLMVLTNHYKTFPFGPKHTSASRRITMRHVAYISAGSGSLECRLRGSRMVMMNGISSFLLHSYSRIGFWSSETSMSLGREEASNPVSRSYRRPTG